MACLRTISTLPSDEPLSATVSAKLIFPTKEIVEEYYLPIIYTACRTCYSEQLPDQIWDKAVSRQVADEKQQNLVRKVMESGHGSTIEHVNFTFAISGVTRTLSHQLVRHRAGTAFDQQSQRYVSFKKRDNFTIPDSITKGDLPDDLAVCGFDDTPVATTVWPELTTIHQPVTAMGRAAVSLMLEDIRRKRNGRSKNPVHQVMKYTLVKRQSSASPRRK